MKYFKIEDCNGCERKGEMTIEQAVEIIGSESNYSVREFAKAVDVLYEFGKEYIKARENNFYHRPC